MPEIRDNCLVMRNGRLMPLLGLGCWQSTANAVEVALDCGYRHIDTAYSYRNEAEVGIGIQNWINKSPNNKREDIFVVTKLPSIGMSPEGVRKFLAMSLKSLQLEYVDLYLIHAPFGWKGKDDQDLFPLEEDGRTVRIDESTDLIAVWKEMEKIAKEGKAKSIGVSSFSIKQLRKIDAISTIPCVTNQIEMHVDFQQKEMVEFCKERNIVITGFSPLGSPDRSSFAVEGLTSYIPSLMDNPVVTLVAQNHKVTTAQVLIKFLIQEGVAAIPKSVNPGRIKSNGDVFSFELSDTEMDALKLLDKGKDGRSFKTFLIPGIDKHPECEAD